MSPYLFCNIYSAFAPGWFLHTGLIRQEIYKNKFRQAGCPDIIYNHPSVPLYSLSLFLYRRKSKWNISATRRVQIYLVAVLARSFYRYGYSAGSHFRNDDRDSKFYFADGSYFQSGLYERGRKIRNLLCVPFSFTFSMLGLVLSSNIFQIYIFWELVGISSFLLIGFYFEKPSAVSASNKAFIVTRFADFGFLIGILILAFYSGTLDFGTLIERLTAVGSPQYIDIHAATFVGVSMLTWGLGLVFIGGAGKSAMFPLHIWLPDAMEGPTPVSALIHAATMVVAGVFLVARLFPVFSIDLSVLQMVTWVGAFSALFAAVIACTQTDIKRILAFSTMSQIGFMMFSLGVSKYGGESGLGYTASMFHLFTHAFFKSLLFLGAGAVIHLAHSNDINDLGGLRKLMPVAHISFLIACLAIAGIPPFQDSLAKRKY